MKRGHIYLKVEGFYNKKCSKVSRSRRRKRGRRRGKRRKRRRRRRRRRRRWRRRRERRRSNCPYCYLPISARHTVL